MKNQGIMTRLEGFLAAWFLRSQRATWRVHIEGREQLDRLFASEHFILCFWHGKYLPIFPVLEGYKAHVITSRSHRGNIISEICRNFGYQTTQISDRPGHDAHSQMEEILSEVSAVGIAVDGPLGPRHRVKSGVIRLASTLGFILLPVSMDCRQKVVSKKRWDHMEFPLPLTRVCMVFGNPIKIPPNLSNTQILEWADHLAEAITNLDRKARNMVRSVKKNNIEQ
jgi:lysophospholipid acyltransferase (LPLAT)-like uncharacterized protein